MKVQSTMSDQISQSIATLKNNGVIVFPTETVWGIGTSVDSLEGISKLYQIKGREFTKPSQILVQDLDMAKRYGHFEGKALELAQAHWPGALTLVVPAIEEKVSTQVRADEPLVGLRCPNHPVIQEIIQGLDVGLVASSANFAGGQAPQTFEDIDQDWLAQVDLVLEGKAGGESSSTVAKVLDNGEIEILRQGELRL